MKTVNIQTAKTHLSSLVEEAVAGEEIVIAKAGKPMVRLVPVEGKSFERKPGALKGTISMREYFDDPLPLAMAETFGIKP